MPRSRGTLSFQWQLPPSASANDRYTRAQSRQERAGRLRASVSEKPREARFFAHRTIARWNADVPCVLGASGAETLGSSWSRCRPGRTQNCLNGMGPAGPLAAPGPLGNDGTERSPPDGGEGALQLLGPGRGGGGPGDAALEMGLEIGVALTVGGLRAVDGGVVEHRPQPVVFASP